MKKTTSATAGELTLLIGCQSFTKSASRCTGKWAGMTDYGLTFDNGCTVFVSNGMGSFEQNVREFIAAIKTVRANRDRYMEILSGQIAKDNLIAEQEGLKQVKLLDINIETDTNDNFLWPYLLIEVGGKQFRHIESHLKYCLNRNKLDEWLARRAEKTWTAGAVQVPDYIIGNVRYSSTDDLYKIHS